MAIRKIVKKSVKFVLCNMKIFSWTNSVTSIIRSACCLFKLWMMSSSRASVVCSRQGSFILHGGGRLEVLGILSAQKFCKFVVALKSLAQNQKIMAVDLTECRAVVYDNSRFLSCIIVPKCSYVEKHDMIFEALQIGHHLDLFYNVELEQVAAQEITYRSRRSYNFWASSSRHIL